MSCFDPFDLVPNLRHIAGVTLTGRDCAEPRDCGLTGVENDFLSFELVEGSGDGPLVQRRPECLGRAGVQIVEGTLIPGEEGLDVGPIGGRSGYPG